MQPKDDLNVNPKCANRGLKRKLAGRSPMMSKPASKSFFFLSYLKWVTENEPEISAKDKLLIVLRGGTTTSAEAEQGANYI
jgi:hypothetical protein